MLKPSLALFLGFFTVTGCAAQHAKAPSASAVAVVASPPAPAPRPAPPSVPGPAAPDRSAQITGLEASTAAYLLCDQQAVVTCAAACDGGNRYACTELGDKYILGARVKPDRKRGIAMLTRACAEGTEMACLRLAARVDSQDPQLSAALLSRVCLEGVVDPADGCAHAISLIERGAFKPDRAESLALYRRACVLGRPTSACGQVKDLAVDAAATKSATTATGGASNGKLAPEHARQAATAP